MADRSILISWGTPIVGREALSVDVFQQVLKFWDQQQKNGRIADWSMGLADEGTLSEFSGYFIVEATRAQLSELRNDPEYRRFVIKANDVVTQFRAIECSGKASVPRRVEELVATRKALGIGQK